MSPEQGTLVGRDGVGRLGRRRESHCALGTIEAIAKPRRRRGRNVTAISA
jgi:hypothetical protein